MIDSFGKEYGRVEIRRVMNGTDVRYRAAHRGEAIGWAVTLREACERVHAAYVRAHSPGARSGAPQEWELEERRNAPSNPA